MPGANLSFLILQIKVKLKQDVVSITVSLTEQQKLRMWGGLDVLSTVVTNTVSQLGMKLKKNLTDWQFRHKFSP